MRRTIDTERLSHVALRDGSAEDVLIGILLPLLCNDDGVFTLNAGHVKEKLLSGVKIDVEAIATCLAKLVGKGLIRPFEHDKKLYGYIKTWKQWNPDTKPNGQEHEHILQEGENELPGLVTREVLPPLDAEPPNWIPRNDTDVLKWARWLSRGLYRSVLARYESWGRTAPHAVVNPTDTTKKAWISELRNMIVRDKETPAVIWFWILWSHEDSFWQHNILSAQTLRRQLPKLIAAKARNTSQRSMSEPQRASPTAQEEERLSDIVAGTLGVDWEKKILEQLH